MITELICIFMTFLLIVFLINAFLVHLLSMMTTIFPINISICHVRGFVKFSNDETLSDR